MAGWQITLIALGAALIAAAAAVLADRALAGRRAVPALPGDAPQIRPGSRHGKTAGPPDEAARSSAGDRPIRPIP
jgi:hypothetical protein